ncbi:MAG: hypothetical protein HPY66_1670 [Firmicutes bacterium]|nr:hypothetical protein [Bacillota bacterium]
MRNDEKYQGVTVICDDIVVVKTVGMSLDDFLQYREFHESPGKDFESIVNYANWCANRGFKTFLYPDYGLPYWMKFLVKLLFWANQKVCNISKLVIVRCPDHA